MLTEAHAGVLRDQWITDKVLMTLDMGALTDDMQEYANRVFENKDFENLLKAERYLLTDGAYEDLGDEWLWRKEIVTAQLDYLARTSRRPDGTNW